MFKMSSSLKSNFKVEKKYKAFYTGGNLQQSSEGKHLLCQNNDCVEILEIETGTFSKSIQNEGGDEVTSFVLSPDDQILVIAGQSLVLRQWDWKEALLTRTWKAIHTAPVSCMSFDESSTLLATGGSDSTIKVWDVIRKYCTHNLKGHLGVISIVKFDPDASNLRLFSAGNDYHIRVWDLSTSLCMSVLESHYSVITAIVFSPDRSTFYSGGRDNIITVWDMKEFKKEKTIPVYESLEGLVLVPKEKGASKLGIKSEDIHLITAGAKGCLKIWNTSTSQCVHTLDLKPAAIDDSDCERSLTALMYNCKMDIVTVTTHEHNIMMYHIADLSLYTKFIGFQDEILDIRFIGAEDTHIAVSTNSGLVKVFNLENWSCQLLYGHTDTVMSLDVSKDKNKLVSASKDNNIRIWQQDPESSDKCSLQYVACGKGHTSTVQSVAFSRLKDSFIVSGSQDLTLKIWPLPNQLSAESETHLHAKITQKAHEKDINSIAVAPNDKLIATGSQDKTAKLWRASNLALLGVFRGHKNSIWCVQFSPIDQCIATSSADGTIKIWALSDYTCVKSFEGHDASVVKIVFISRGMQLLSTGTDGLLKLWTIKTNECVKTYDEHSDTAWALVKNDHEDILVTGGTDSQIIVWKDVTVEEQEEMIEKQTDLLLREQTLQNLLHQKKYLKAIGLAINLDQPFRVLNIMKEILGEQGGNKALEKTMLKLKDYEIDAVLRYAGTWNTNSKHCHTAQFVLSVIFNAYNPDELFKLPNFKSSLEGLIPYTERHCQRLRKMQQQATFVEYTWQSMRLVSTDSTPESIMAMSNYIEESEFQSKLSPSGHSQSSSSEDESSSSEDMRIAKNSEKKIYFKPQSKLEVDSSISTSDTSDDDNDDKNMHENVSLAANKTNIRSGNKDKKHSKILTTEVEDSNSSFLMDRKGKGDKTGVEDSAFDEIESDDSDQIASNLVSKNKAVNKKKKIKVMQNQNQIGDSSKKNSKKAKLKDGVLKRTRSMSVNSETKIKSGSIENESCHDSDLEEIRTPYTTFKLTGVSRSTGAQKKKRKKIADTSIEKIKNTPQTEPVKGTRKSRLKQNKLKRGKLPLT